MVKPEVELHQDETYFKVNIRLNQFNYVASKFYTTV